MPSLADTEVSQPFSSLKTIFNSEAFNILEHAKGGNSKVFCIEIAGKKWAIKSYPPYAPNQRDRLQAEASTYEFLNQHGIQSVPTFKGISQSERLLVIDWIEGHLPAPTSITANDIQQALAFIEEVAKLNTLVAASTLPLAAEACLSLDILIQQIQKRLERLQQYENDEPELKAFLHDVFLPLFTSLQNQSKSQYQLRGLSTSSELDPSKRSLIPADFGFHNALRDANGKLYFFDFDYFGWDDPVKLLADLLWHPKMALNTAQAQQFTTGIANIYQQDADFLFRFEFTMPLFGLRWSLILLNEFIPDFWQNRQHANVHENHAIAKQKQLKIAHDFTSRINP